MGYSFHQPTAIEYGAGALNNLGEKAAVYGKKTLIACDPFMMECGLADRVQKILSESGIESVVFPKVMPNPIAPMIDEGAKLAEQEKCEFVIGLGGGSSMDTAKGIAVAATHPDSVWAYAIGEKEITDAVLPVVSVTTTSGTGSQCTMFSVITNPETNQKPGMGSPFILPKLAIVDPELTASMPKGLTLLTGFDVFCHAVEAYTSAAASPIGDMYSEKALELVGKYLPEAYENGSDMEAREAMALADTYAGIAINHGVVSLAHVMAHVISGHLEEIAHGEALFWIYREVLKFNSTALQEKHEFIAKCLDPGNKDIVSAFDKFFNRFIFPENLKKKIEETPELLTKLAEDTFTYMAGIVELNPVAATVADVEKILKSSFS